MKRMSFLQTSEPLKVIPFEEFIVDVEWRNKGETAGQFIVQAYWGTYFESGAIDGYGEAQASVSLAGKTATLTSLTLTARSPDFLGVWDIIVRIIDSQGVEVLALKVAPKALRIQESVAANISIVAVTNLGP